MADVVNLRLARKRKQREEAGREAAHNRAAHGRTKAEKRAAQDEHDTQLRRLEGHRLTKPDEQ
ncbi:MAG: DUF4169 family protein [Rhizobiaceae bacterium]|nr:DUF4169 family protein [Rhizobiaceae bacterium]